MKAPDKIFVCIPQRLNMSTFKEDSKYVGIAYTDRGSLTSSQIEEYISKDALLEWIKGTKKGWEEIGQRAVIIVLDALTEKLNSL